MTVAVAAIVVLALTAVVSYNRFVSQRQLVKDSWADVDTELRRRFDLVPNLVATVKGYAAHERAVFECVARARSAADVGAGVKSLLAVAESYPELKADEQFRSLERELADTEDRIQAARRIFNANVRSYNRRVAAFPSNVVAVLGGFSKLAYFEVEPAVRVAPHVSI